MKKIMAILTVAATFVVASAFVANNRTVSSLQQPDTCTTVGNCSVQIQRVSGKTKQVVANNYNEFKVTVTWKVMGYPSSGNARVVDSGSLVVESGKNKVHYFTTECTDLYLTDVHVYKCN
ncbi:MAG: hypothetical protein IJU92_04015 [Spirochaetaceae bacterium]|nr:hypothetical protein [Spirochaetaceae bacterium]